ncbi:hypothetical protein V5P93_003361 [Actinokineospora auranticolor]|nr:hypothetical protein [Actinokineospora auranticolor]
MEHAREIKDKAVEYSMQQLAQEKGRRFPGSAEREQFNQRYGFIEPMFEPFFRLPDPAGYDPLIADVNAAMARLNTGSVSNTDLSEDVTLANPHLDKMTTDGGYLLGWNGEAAMAFKANFVDPFKTISGNQFTVLSTLKGVLQAHRELWVRARDDIDKIAENAKNALDNAGGCGKNQWSFGFSVVSAVVSIGGVFVAAATGGVVALAAIGAAASVGGASVAGLTASGDSVDTIVNSMRQAVDELTRYIQEVESGHIAQKAQALAEAVRANKDKIVAARPSLAGMSDRDLTGGSGMGRPD